MNPIAVVTGASRGLGRALSLALAARGHDVALIARESSDLRAVAAEIEALGRRPLVLAADLGDPAALDPLSARIAEGLGAPSLVVLAASTLGPVPLAPVLDTDDALLARALAVNVVGSIGLARRLAPSMLLGGGGTIVAISSDAAVEAYPTWGAYGASKAALDHLVRVWAAELDGALRVVSVDPGEMDTVMHRDAVPGADPATLQRPEDVAARLLDWLAASSSVTRIALPAWQGAA